MVRITLEDRGTGRCLKLEGKLAGAWVNELEQCWRSLTARTPGVVLSVDLTAAESVDLAGKYLLSLMHQSGVQLTANSPYMKALVAEILGTTPNAAGKALATRAESNSEGARSEPGPGQPARKRE